MLDGNGVGDPNDSGNPYSDTGTVQIAVNLVQATPDVSSNLSTDDLASLSTNETFDLEYTVTSNANGVDTYTLLGPSAGAFSDGNVFSDDSGSAAASTSVTTVDPFSQALTLGATSFAGTTDITFLADGTPSSTSVTVPMDSLIDGDLSGFDGGGSEIIVFRTTGTSGGEVAGEVACTVDSISEVATAPEIPNGTATITISSCVTDDALATETRRLVYGDQAGERQTLTITIETGDVTGDVSFDAEISYTGDATPHVFSETLNIFAVDLRVEKFVRNITNTGAGFDGSCSNGVPFDCLEIEAGGTDDLYYATGVNANPGDVLEYAILLYNVNGDVTSVLGTDPIVLFTTYVEDSSILLPTVVATQGGTALCHDTNGTCRVTDPDGTSAPTAVVSDTTGDGPSPVDDALDNTAASGFVYVDDTGDPVVVRFSAGDNGTPDTAPATETAGGQILETTETDEANASVFIFQVVVDS